MPIFDMPQGGILVKQWKSMKVPAVMAGFISPLAGSDAWSTFDKKIGGAMNSIFELGSAVSSDRVPPSVTFGDAYRKTYGKPLQAGHGPAPSYESVYILAEAIERSDAYSIAGGGDTLAAIDQFRVRDGISYISTGGGAFLEFVEGKTLPAVAALEAVASR